MFTYEINFSPKEINPKYTDIWGAAFIWKGDKGCEFNLAYDNGVCCSAIYKCDGRGKYLDTDYTEYYSYEVRKNSEDWAKELIKEMIKAYHEFWER